MPYVATLKQPLNGHFFSNLQYRIKKIDQCRNSTSHWYCQYNNYCDNINARIILLRNKNPTVWSYWVFSQNFSIHIVSLRRNTQWAIAMFYILNKFLSKKDFFCVESIELQLCYSKLILKFIENVWWCLTTGVNLGTVAFSILALTSVLMVFHICLLEWKHFRPLDHFWQILIISWDNILFFLTHFNSLRTPIIMSE